MFFVVFLCFWACSLMAEKILFITHAFNRPDFLEIQVKTFNKLLKDPYELVVFNDSPNSYMEQQINEKCALLGLRVFRVPQHLHMRPGRQSAGHRHMDGIQYALDTIGYDYDGIVVLIDSDMFLVKEFNVAEYMKGVHLAGDLQGRSGNGVEVRYLSPALAFMNMGMLPDKRSLCFEGGYIHGLACDVGAYTYYYMQAHPELTYTFYDQIHIGAWKIIDPCSQCSMMSCPACIARLVYRGFDDTVIRFIQECPDDIEFNMKGTFLHYRCGSNWNNKPADYVAAKTNALNNLVARIIAQ